VEHVTVRFDGRVGWIRLERPDRRNAITSSMLDDITAACSQVGESGVDIAVLSGSGASFSVGFDLDEIAGGGTPEGAYAGARAVEALLDLEAVTIARLSGWVVGGGAALAAACDFRVGDPSVVFRIPEVPLGIPLGWGAMPLLVAELGPSLSKDLVMTGRDMTAEEAFARGFLTRLAPEGELDQVLEDLVQRLLAVPPGPMRTTKRQVAAAASIARTGQADADRLIAALESPGFVEVFGRYLEGVRGRLDDE
jgi:enoyl-CoA hydratase/carnithine racemase